MIRSVQRHETSLSSLPHQPTLNRTHNTSILIPIQHRIITRHRLRLLQKRPPLQKILLPHDPREPSSQRLIHAIHNLKVCRKQNIKEALLHLYTYQPHSFAVGVQEHTNGVETGILILLYLVCTTGAFTPCTASGSAWKSLISSLCAGKLSRNTSKNSIIRVGIYSGTDKFPINGILSRRRLRNLGAFSGWLYPGLTTRSRILRKRSATGSSLGT